MLIRVKEKRIHLGCRKRKYFRRDGVCLPLCNEPFSVTLRLGQRRNVNNTILGPMKNEPLQGNTKYAYWDADIGI